MHNLSGTTLGDYRIEQVLGQGGMGTVYQGRNLYTGRQVAIKQIRGLQPDGAAALLKEARSLDQLDHPNIVRLLHCGADAASGSFYLVLELVTGGTLGDLIRAQARAGRQAELDLALDLAVQAAEGLAHAHQFLVHHDIKADNMLLQPRSTPGPGGAALTLKIGDFGLARIHRRLTHQRGQGRFEGTPEYAAPEQFDGQVGDARSDLYALGVVLYELLTGVLPFRFTPGNLREAREAHLHQQPAAPGARRPGLAPPLDHLVLRCMARRPEDRFQRAEELVAALRAIGPTRNGATALPPTVIAAPPPLAPTVVAAPAGGVADDAPKLLILDRAGACQSVALGRRQVVGRDPTCAIVLPSDRVSGRHLQIDWDGGSVTITDLGSSNGTLLAGRALPANQPQPWPRGAELLIKPYRLRLVAPPSGDGPPGEPTVRAEASQP